VLSTGAKPKAIENNYEAQRKIIKHTLDENSLDVPLCFCVLKDKHVSTYLQECFKSINKISSVSYNFVFEPKEVITDFEKAIYTLHNACDLIWPNAKLIG